MPLMSEAEFEAKQLEDSLEKAQMHEKELQKQDELMKVRAVSNLPTGSVNAAADDKSNGIELIEGQSDIHLDNMEFSQNMIGQQAVAKIQAQLEAKVQKELDQLTIIANNQFGGGKHLYDYQLVRLTEGQQKAEREALEKADEIYHKHSTLKKKEEQLNDKFQKARQQLDLYKEKFYKDKKDLQQDHDSFVKIKSETEKELQ